jgi:RNA polymerase sigma-70 factor, ECF subfamily
MRLMAVPHVRQFPVSLGRAMEDAVEKPWDVDLSIYDDEQELLAGLRRRDRLACTCLLKRFAPRLLRLSMQLMGDADEAEDVLQESFIRACDQIDRFRGESGIGTWLHRIVINTALMRLRRSQVNRPARQSGELADHDALATVADHNAVEPGQRVADQEMMERISAAIAGLPESLRLAFVLRELEGLSTRDAAALLGISESALKVRLHRARLALRRELARYMTDSEPPAPGQLG